MEKMKRTAIGRLSSWLLAIAMVVTSLTVPGTVAFAEEVEADGATGEGSWVDSGLVVNGDFEDELATEWVIPHAEYTDSYSKMDWVENSDSGALNKSNYMNIYNGTVSANTMSIKQENISVEPGTYKLSFQQEGAKFASGLSVKIEDYINEALPATTDYNNWADISTAEFVIEEGTTISIEFSGAVTAGYWGKLDNIVLYKWQEEPKETFDKSVLQSLVDSVPADYATMGFKDTAALQAALTAANACLAKEEATETEITNCCTALETALESLVLWDEDVFVKKISSISDNSIRGMDISSYISIMDTFDALNTEHNTDTFGFKDYDGNVLSRQGFFTFLANAGVNYVRIRVWNDPYNSESGLGYGGGNNDLDKAVEMGKYASVAGMDVLIDFHYSDFWADPGKQQAPKAWAGKSVAEKAEALSAYTTDSLNTLLDAGVNVTMVQVGNESNASMCGETAWVNLNVLFDAGCDAVHAVAAAHDTEILAAVHFTNPESSGKQAGYAAELASYNDGEGVSYDVFATSYYPYWHGTLAHLSSVLSGIAKTYDKYVMVAETSYANTLEDTDGHDNTVRVGNNDTVADCPWMFTKQGQIDEFRDVLATITDIDVTLSNGDKAGLGVFYWEGAWIAVQDPYEDGSVNAEKLAENKALWEKYGSGWAASYATEYDSTDAGKWYGGSAVDNQAFFGVDGKALTSLKVYDPDNLKYGAETTVKVDGYTADAITMQVGENVSHYLGQVNVVNNDGTSGKAAVNWSQTDIARVNTKAANNNGIGSYTVNGVLASDTSFAVECTVKVEPKNILSDYSFENKVSSWKISGTGAAITGDDPKSGEQSCHFYSGSAFDFTVSQDVTVTTAGVYNGSAYIQGGNAGTVDAYLDATVSGNTVSGNTVEVEGWCVWKQPSVEGVVVTPEMIEAGNNVVTYTLHVDGGVGSWGTIDDAYFYLDEEIILYPTQIAIKESNVSIVEGNSKKLTVSYKPTATNAKAVDWTSSSNAIATVDATGNVTAKKAGKVTITATSKYDATVSGSCTVTVTAKPEAPKPETPETPAPEAPKAVGTTEKTDAGSFEVTVSETGAAEVEFTAPASAKTKKVTIPETVEIDGISYAVTSVADKAFKNNKTVTTVKLGSNITEIGSGAFQGCTKLKTVTLGANVETVGASAFRGCTALKKVSLPKSVTTIGSKAFYGDKNLKTITIKSSSITKVGSGAFKGIKANATIKVPSKKVKAYKKLFKGKGQKSTVKIKK